MPTTYQGATMITQHDNITLAQDNLLRQIEIKDRQLQIAQEFGMFYVVEKLHIQLSNLQSQLSDLQDPQFEALMSLLDD